MLPIADSFEHVHRGCEIRYGRGRIADLGGWLGERDLDDALVVCGSNTGANDALMDPVREGLGDRLAGVFDGTTPDKRVETAYDLLDARAEVGADVLVGVGGGASLDVARQATLLAADGRDIDELRADAEAGGDALGDLAPASDPAVPFVVVPTTFAGADVSTGGSLEVFAADESPTDQPVNVSGSGAWPIADVADPALFETTPPSVLAGSAMNGFNKGIETPYARDADPVSDAAAVHGLRLLSDALPRVAGDRPGGEEATDRAVVGALLVQLGRKINVLHAFGHGFARRYDIQQGAIHAVIAPHALAYLFDEVDASRRALAAGLGVRTDGRDDDAIAEDVVAAVAGVRDALDVPTRLRDLPETDEEDLPAIAEFVAEDPPMERAPADLDATAEGVLGVLRAAW
ncbi:iron-containing alcohol dehydrogenase [Halorubrum californiense DSM 19288]|uniref:Iron-containing alcohol dehydrogenase n=1 Tax=Halorubrum californiense DSM 19288 TaxID=1227465 RepID=M0EAE5_9EURY|nr:MULTISPECIES: iron-containing alcohol dehydrogenase family protein [Halorubrum]ELZ44735.1 iron-containing alcohol dehydrogenase [Halorubrum californiense DSM 19288]TKX71773.1 iron-containing alcohol dehydrogenase [Halorubrum sp. GN11GM_10-3_MGM]